MKHLFRLAKLAEAYDQRGQKAVADCLDSALTKLAANGMEPEDTYAGGFREGVMSAAKLLDVSSDLPTIKRYLLQLADTLQTGPHAGVPAEALPPDEPLANESFEGGEPGQFESAAADGKTGGQDHLQRLLNFDL